MELRKNKSKLRNLALAALLLFVSFIHVSADEKDDFKPKKDDEFEKLADADKNKSYTEIRKEYEKVTGKDNKDKKDKKDGETSFYKETWFLILMGIVVFIAVASAGYYFFGRNKDVDAAV